MLAPRTDPPPHPRPKCQKRAEGPHGTPLTTHIVLPLCSANLFTFACLSFSLSLAYTSPIPPHLLSLSLHFFFLYNQQNPSFYSSVIVVPLCLSTLFHFLLFLPLSFPLFCLTPLICVYLPLLPLFSFSPSLSLFFLSSPHLCSSSLWQESVDV